MTYKINGNITHASKIHIFHNDVYKGYKDVNSGAYNVVFDTITASGITVVAEKNDGNVIGYGNVVSLTSSGTDELTGGSVSGFNNIQPFDITIANGFSQATQTITAVDLDKSFIIFNGSTCREVGGQYDMAIVELINSTTVRATRYGAINNCYVKGYIMELPSGVKSIQRGTVSLPADSNYDPPQVVDETITAVDTSKTFITFTERSSTGHDNKNNVTVDLVNSTTLRISRNCQYKNYVHEISYEIIEMD